MRRVNSSAAENPLLLIAGLENGRGCVVPFDAMDSGINTPQPNTWEGEVSGTEKEVEEVIS